MKLLGIDGSLTATGFLVLELDAGERLLEESFCGTKPDGKSRHVYQADQDGARVDELVDELLRLVRLHQPDVVAIEAPAGSQHANAAKALALVYGGLRGALRTLGITPVMVQAHHAKKAATGSQSASKHEVEAAMQRRFGLATTGSKPRKEAIADAAAVCCAAMGEPTVQALRRRGAAPTTEAPSLFG